MSRSQKKYAQNHSRQSSFLLRSIIANSKLRRGRECTCAQGVQDSSSQVPGTLRTILCKRATRINRQSQPPPPPPPPPPPRRSQVVLTPRRAFSAQTGWACP